MHQQQQQQLPQVYKQVWMGNTKVSLKEDVLNAHSSSPAYIQGASYPPTDLAELVNLVSAQQSTLYSQQAEIKQVVYSKLTKNEKYI